MWQNQIDTFQSHFDVIAPNLAGFGDSSHLLAPELIPECAQQAFDLLDFLGIDQFYLFGHSIGGMVVQQMLLMQSSRVKKLICYGTGPVGDLPDRFETLDKSRQHLVEDGLESTVNRMAATWLIEGGKGPGFTVCQAVGKQASLQAAFASINAGLCSQRTHGKSQFIQYDY